MDNLSHVIAIDIQPGQLSPCLRINRGIYAGSLQNAQFQVEVSVTYTSGGLHQGPIVSTQLVSGTQFMQVLDAHSIRAKGQPIALRAQPDTHSLVVVATRVLINDASGAAIECWSADTNSFRAP